MTLDQAKEVTFQRFQDEWGSTTPFAFEGESSDLDGGLVPWVRVSFRPIGGGQQTLGGPGTRKFHRHALIFVQVFTPINSGTKTGSTLAKQAQDIFEATAFGEIDGKDGRIRDTIEVDGKWQMTLVEVDCDFYETK